MSRYHISPDTNKPNICRAQTPDTCPLKSEAGGTVAHFDNKADAKAYAEKTLTEEHGETSSLSKSSPKAQNPWRKDKEQRREEEMRAEEEMTGGQEEYFETVDDSPERSNVYQYMITEANYEKAINSIETANNKLAKAGIHDRFEYEMEEKQATKIDEYGRKLEYVYYNLKLNRPTISYENNGEKYTFLAAISRADAGYVTRTASGVELHGWKPDNLVCDHCGQKRLRNKTYIVENPDGKRLQIGSACVDVFLGTKPAGLWAMSSDPVEDFNENSMGGVFQQVPKSSSEDVMAMALAVTSNGDYYVSKARETETGVKSTYTKLSEAMFMSRADLTDSYDQEYFDELDMNAARYRENGRAKDVLEQLKNIEGKDDYIENVRTLANGEFIKRRDIPLLISGIAALNRIEREKQREADFKKAKDKKIAEFTPGHFGNVWKKINKGTALKLHSTREFRDTDYWGNDIIKTVVTAKDEDGHMVSWFTGVEINEEPGDDILLSSGKIKNHGNYQGIDQTMLSNVRLLKKK